MRQIIVSLAILFSLIASGLAIMLGMHSLVFAICMLGIMVLLASGAMDEYKNRTLQNTALLGMFALVLVAGADHIWG